MVTPRVHTETISNVPKNNYSRQELKGTPILKKKTNENVQQVNESAEVFQMMKSVYQNRKRDEYDVFGEMVAHSIRDLKSDYLKVITQQQISNLLYEARIRQITQLNPQSTTPLPSPSSSQPSFTSYSSGMMTPTQQEMTQYSQQGGSNNSVQPEEPVDILQRAFRSAFQNN